MIYPDHDDDGRWIGPALVLVGIAILLMAMIWLPTVCGSAQ